MTSSIDEFVKRQNVLASIRRRTHSHLGNTMLWPTSLLLFIKRYDENINYDMIEPLKLFLDCMC